jgi:hypothetical protein
LDANIDSMQKPIGSRSETLQQKLRRYLEIKNVKRTKLWEEKKLPAGVLKSGAGD